MSAPRDRLDSELVRRGLVASRQEAREAIAAGRVTVDGLPATKAATRVDRGQRLDVPGGRRRWVSRGGDKLDGALDVLGIAVADRVCLDAGASTGGFTDVLLSRGARTVFAVDVGYGQLAWSLRTDPRVVVLERTHVRDLTSDLLDGVAPDLVVADLSFISLASMLAPLRAVAAPTADWCCLVKPQFEAGRDHVGRGGVVRDPAGWRAALRRVTDAAASVGLPVVDGAVSPVPGPSGNVEFFLRLGTGGVTVGSAHRGGSPAGAVGPSGVLVDRLIADGRTLRGDEAR